MARFGCGWPRSIVSGAAVAHGQYHPHGFPGVTPHFSALFGKRWRSFSRFSTTASIWHRADGVRNPITGGWR